MTPEKIQSEILELQKHQIKCDAEREKIMEVVSELKEDVKTVKDLAEDIHIMAINMENMQRTLDNAIKKIDVIEKKDYTEYKERKKIVRDKIISGVVGAIVTASIGILTFILTKWKEGGM